MLRQTVQTVLSGFLLRTRLQLEANSWSKVLFSFHFISSYHANYIAWLKTFRLQSLAAKQDPSEIFNKSVNDGSMLGVGWLPGTIGGGIRNSSANYLMSPPSNLEIITGATVTKVLIDSEGSEPTATGIEYVLEQGGERLSETASRVFSVSLV